jgi:phosphatidylserine decarboxylase
LDSATDASNTPSRALKPITERIGSLVGIAAEGVPIALSVAIGGIILLAAQFTWVGILVIAAAIAVGSFFRDPERKPADVEGTIIAAADGKVCDIVEAPIPGDASGELCRRVSVFMSPLNVHVNRAPVSGEVVSITYTPGEFRAAFRDKASKNNERNVIIFTDAAHRRHAIVQIAGYLARRIVCHIRPNETVKHGQRVGLIMFGSRVDHFMPSDYRVAVTVGDRVRAGESIIGKLYR